MLRRWGALAAFALAACSSSTPTGGAADASADASVGPGRPADATCDPALGKDACALTFDPCSALVCDPTSRLCLIETTDAGGCTAGVTTCQTSAECGGGVCLQGLCYQTCLFGSDCDGGTCTTACTTPPGCTDGDACAQTCSGYCTVTPP